MPSARAEKRGHAEPVSLRVPQGSADDAGDQRNQVFNLTLSDEAALRRPQSAPGFRLRGFCQQNRSKADFQSTGCAAIRASTGHLYAFSARSQRSSSVFICLRMNLKSARSIRRVSTGAKRRNSRHAQGH